MIERIDYAELRYRESWLSHPIYGDASFDCFERGPGNPVCRGTDEMRWPVNDSLFRDPVSGNWFLYVGWYRQNYERDLEHPSHCLVYRSTDAGISWEELGPALPGLPGFLFRGETSPASSAPDAVVAFKDGKYHMAFDWGTHSSNWGNAHNPTGDQNSGAGYAVSDRPEGPFQPQPNPITTTRDSKAVLGKYRRQYATTILPRRKDWLALTLTDSGPHFGWGFVASSASTPDGPWSEPVLVLHPEREIYYPPLLEFHPAFAHEGYVFAPCTSVARNRNYQGLFRVPAEQALDPDAWELWRCGSLWHAEPVENEHEGIWGQTISGFVDAQGTFSVAFPSRDDDNRGTINIAKRPWDSWYREQGFVVSGHAVPSVTVIDREFTPRRIECELSLRGTVAIIWGHRAPFGPDRHGSNAGASELTLASHSAVELTDNSWFLMKVDAVGTRSVVATGSLAPAGHRLVDLRWVSGELALSIDGEEVHRSAMAPVAGKVGLLAGTRGWAEICCFAVEGDSNPGRFEYLYGEALLSAAQKAEDWEVVEDRRFSYGCGAVSKSGDCAAKWNFRGAAVELLAPRGPEYGRGTVRVDGGEPREIDFLADEPRDSEVVWAAEDLQPGYHAVGLSVVEGRVPVDLLVYTSP